MTRKSFIPKKIIQTVRILSAAVILIDKFRWHPYDEGISEVLYDYAKMTHWGMILSSVTMIFGFFNPVDN